MTTNISAAQVKELRDRTGAGMMECKKALEHSGGDLEGALEELRKQGITKAGKKAGRIAAEGLVTIIDDGKCAAMVEINCETDFVSRDHHLSLFAKTVAEVAFSEKTEDVTTLGGLALEKGSDSTIEQERLNLVAKMGENIQIRRVVVSHNPSVVTLGTYIHSNRIGVVVELDVDNKELARDIAMHIAASHPLVISPDHVPADVVAKEKEIYMAQAAESGKPHDIVEKMVAGRLKKYLDEVSLIGQAFVKDPDVTVGTLLNKHRAKVLAFYRFEVGEGIEKTSEDFKQAVLSQVKGNS